ncbi:Flagellar assembly protein FliH/Type III secretion system HrpE [Moorella glycerini]|uniref:Yop proteins translocation protein L n=1 Tax=Neomoorella stamsii TaxID=1266720 RepID=A0A9X7J383_9FIRM|nr:Yop proteins translocation protein L [Moorella stamsii]CEP68898.1 Flagellar assembly protein FliH/Type III secretion system HrpE [Moorella glycerini]CEP69592.1 Flagellar assembly protein FliH/Type III secretion system HrpE [Moorella glycerini]
MLSRILKKAGAGWGERVIPLRPVQVAAAIEYTGEEAGKPEARDEMEANPAREVTAAREEAAALLEQARREAAAIKEAAVEERQEVLEEARAAGEARGYQEGLARAEGEAERIRREAEAAREEARQVLAEAQKAYQETISAAEGEIIELALAIASKIIGQEIELRPDLVLEIARQAIRQVAEGQNYIIYASPEAAETIRQRRAELLAEAAPGARLQVIADPGFKAGGCRVETENGFVDASVDSQLEELKKIFRVDARAAHTAPDFLSGSGAASSPSFPTSDFQPPTSVLAGGRP